MDCSRISFPHILDIILQDDQIRSEFVEHCKKSFYHEHVSFLIRLREYTAYARQMMLQKSQVLLAGTNTGSSFAASIGSLLARATRGSVLLRSKSNPSITSECPEDDTAMSISRSQSDSKIVKAEALSKRTKHDHRCEQAAQAIVKQFIVDMAPMELNVDIHMKQQVTDRLSQGQWTSAFADVDREIRRQLNMEGVISSFLEQSEHISSIRDIYNPRLRSTSIARLPVTLVKTSIPIAMAFASSHNNPTTANSNKRSTTQHDSMNLLSPKKLALPSPFPSTPTSSSSSLPSWPSYDDISCVISSTIQLSSTSQLSDYDSYYYRNCTNGTDDGDGGNGMNNNNSSHNNGGRQQQHHHHQRTKSFEEINHQSSSSGKQFTVFIQCSMLCVYMNIAFLSVLHGNEN